MFFTRIQTPGLSHNSYVIGNSENDAIIIDPRRDIDDYLQLLSVNGLTLRYVLETHRQEDFILGSRALAEATGAKIVHGDHPNFEHGDIRLKDQEELKIGDIAFRALQTPGHTLDSFSYAIFLKELGDHAWGVFTGDALFFSATGRTDLIEPSKTAGNAKLLYNGLHQKILPLGDHVLLFPAHGAGSSCGRGIADREESTLGLERLSNAVFKLDRDGFAQLKAQEKIEQPPYFSYMRKVNTRGGIPMQDPRKVAVLGPKEFAEQMKRGIVIDTRSPEAFAGAHIPKSYNIWLEGISNFAGWIADENTKVFLVVESPAQVRSALLALGRIGIDQVKGVLNGGFSAWRNTGLPIDTLGTVAPKEVEEMRREQKLQILDVRSNSEWNQGHIPGARHVFVGDIKDHISHLKSDESVVITCGVGSRASLAASILKQNDFTRVFNMLGGMKAWNALKLPLETKEGRLEAA